MILLKSTFSCLCNECFTPLGFFDLQKENIFCYKCQGFQALDKEECFNYCEREMHKLRRSFRRLITEGNAYRYLRNLLNVLETIFVSDQSDLSPNIEVERKIELLQWNVHFFVFMTIGIRWILEDLNYKIKDSQKFEMGADSKILASWSRLNLQRIYLENELGIFIKNEEVGIKFYNFKQLLEYHNSVGEFSTFHERSLNKDNLKEKIKNFFDKQNNPSSASEMISNDFPLTYLTSLYEKYPDKEDRIFSFEDVLESSIPSILAHIIELYDNRRVFRREELGIMNFFAETSLAQLKEELKNIPWSFDLIYSMLIASPRNPMAFPLIIEYGGKVLISPTRLKVARKLMIERLNHNMISADLSKLFENEFQDIVLNKFEKKGFKVIDPISYIEWVNIMDKKRNSFEFDILAHKDGEIFVIECKSFHPHPFYELNEARLRRKEQFLHFHFQFKNRIKPWLYQKLRQPPKKGVISISCRQFKISDKSSSTHTINLPESLHRIKKKKIKALYITQIKEEFFVFSNIPQLYFKDF